MSWPLRPALKGAPVWRKRSEGQASPQLPGTGWDGQPAGAHCPRRVAQAAGGAVIQGLSVPSESNRKL